MAFSGGGSSDADGLIASYSWNFGDGATATGPAATHTYTTAGVYDARLTVTDNVGATASTVVRITVNAQVLRSTSVTLSGNRNGSTVNLQGQVQVRNTSGAAVSGVTVSATWRKPDGSTASRTATTNTSGAASFSTSGPRGTYTLTVTNLAKTGYTFDTAGSVLSASITLTAISGLGPWWCSTGGS